MNEKKEIPAFLNQPVYPDMPMSVPEGFTFVFARTVALELLNENVHITKAMLKKMSNEELGAKLVEASLIYPEFMGGVVDDKEPNGYMPASVH
jgi:hypothetical protein